MKKIFLTLSTITFISYNIQADNYAPRFISDETGQEYIAVASQGGLCGGFTVNKRGYKTHEVLLRAYKWDGKLEYTGAEVLSPARLSARYRYDWTSSDPGSHYRIYCLNRNESGQWVPAKCSAVVTIDNVKHNVGCVEGPAGPEANYAPLWMNKAK